MNQSDLTRLLADSVANEPSFAAGFAETTISRARRATRRRRGVVAAVTVAVLALVVGVSVPWFERTDRQQATNSPTPSLPTAFAPFSPLTARAIDSPAGRAIAIYVYGSGEAYHTDAEAFAAGTMQILVAGADRDTYRRIDVPGSTPEYLLSPDGRFVLTADGADASATLTLLDLTTGATSTRHGTAWSGQVVQLPDAVTDRLRLLAWSPDGRYVAYSEPGRVSILDLTTDTSVTHAVDAVLDAAAFSPDGTRLATQTTAGGSSTILALDGSRVGTWTSPKPVSGPYSFLFWSPDDIIATDSSSGSYPNIDTFIQFVDVTGQGRPVPATLPLGDMLGWRSPTSILVELNLGIEIVPELVEISTVDGSQRVISRFSHTRDCGWGLSTCFTENMRVATTLLPDAATRPSDPDRGPFALTWFSPRSYLTAIVVLVLTIVAGIAATRARGRRRRRRL